MVSILGSSDISTQQHLFSLELQFQPSAEQRTSSKGKPGHYIGSGVGIAQGQKVSGNVQFDFYEDPAPDRCEASIVGTIVTEDGGSIEFETRGYLYPDKSRQDIWHTNSEVRFTTDDARYTWLNGVAGTWEGEFNSKVRRGESRVYLARTMNTELVAEIASRLRAVGVPPDFGPDRSRLLIQTYRALAKGRPLTADQVNEIATNLGIDREDAEGFLREVTERDAEDNIIGVIGLSLNEDWVHRFYVNGASLRTWCAWDSLFIAPLLKQTVTIESDSPETKETVRVTVGQEGIEQTNPADAVVTVVALDPKKHDVSSLEAIWGAFCHQVYFFASREEAERWAAGREDIEVLTVEEAYELGKQSFNELNSYA